MDTILNILDYICYGYFFVAVAYLLFFSVFARRKSEKIYPLAKQKHRILAVFPAYSEDQVIVKSISSFLKQDYPNDLYTVMVVSDHMEEKTNEELEKYPIQLVRAHFENSSKAAALNLAVSSISTSSEYDIIAVVDADNEVDADFLNKINDAYDSGVKALQVHRKSKRNTAAEIAVLDAVSEEINNSIFRAGHIRSGFSSALSGSGMAFDFKWFADHISLISTAGEDKELELLLLKEGVFVDYLPDVYAYDAKVSKVSVYSKQRRRWIAAQFDILSKGLSYLPTSLVSGNWNYCDKIFQWMILPRILLLGFIFMFAMVWLFVDYMTSLKWWLLLLLLLFTLMLAIPKDLYNASLYKAIKQLPLLFLLTAVNLFRTKGVNKRFIHTRQREE